jgi:aspartate kinase
MKFGGSSLAAPSGMRRAGDIIERHAREHQVVVVSASGDVTDRLMRAAQGVPGWSMREINSFIQELRRLHLDIIEASGRPSTPQYEMLDPLFEHLKLILTGISILGELTPRSLDHILSFGERLSAPLLAYELSTMVLPTKVLTGGEAGLITDSSFGEANPVWRETRRRVRRVLKPLLESNTIPVITGFIGQTSGGEVTTLGRGGSDYTATILADALNADEVWIWTDVDGLMTADPRVVWRTPG